eukprot:SM000213S06806  [mRNA]  locus=s213:55493:59090:+ [translate_table: standard]
MQSIIKPLLGGGGGDGRDHPTVIAVAPTRPDLDCSSGCGLADGKGISGDAAERDDVRRKLTMAIALCLVFMVVEIVGGLLSNSLSILTDAAHLLSDIAGFAISLFALWMAGWEATPTHTFGYYRMEILGALVSIQLIWMITGILVYEAIIRMLYTSQTVDGRLMFATAAFGVAVNVAMSVLLSHDHHGHSHGGGGGHKHVATNADSGHGHGHDSHGHGHDHAHGGCGGLGNSSSHGNGHPVSPQKSATRSQSGGHFGNGRGSSGTLTPRRSAIGADLVVLPLVHYARLTDAAAEPGPVVQQNINLQGAHLHVLGDLVQSVGVMIAGLVIWFRPEWKVVDLVCTLVFSVLVLGTTLKMLRDIMEVLMESTPREIDAEELEQGLRRLEEVVDVHELHIWCITRGKIVLACHVRCTNTGNNDEVLHRVLDFCEQEYGITHATVQVERSCEAESYEASRRLLAATAG